MRDKHLQTNGTTTPAHNSGILPRKRWQKLGLALLLALTFNTWGCKDSEPGLTNEELVSDPLPDFDDSILAGEWLVNGTLVGFEVKDHGEYLIPADVADTTDDKAPKLFRLKRVGDFLFLEYTLDFGTFKAYRPCRIDINEHGLEFHCFVAPQLEQLGLTFETHAYGEETIKTVNAGAERLRAFFTSHALNKQVFEPELRYTRPQPARIARLRKNAIAGNAEAQEQLSIAYHDGEIVERSYDEALLWAEKSARSGRPSAQVLLGDLLVETTYRTQDTMAADALRSEARYWYELAAEQKFPHAYYRLGILYETGSFTDEAYAIECFRRGMELGDAASQENLGLRYFFGKGVAPDQRVAQQYLEGLPDAVRDPYTWATLSNLYLSAVDSDLRDPKRALAAAERALAGSQSCENEALFARASFENELYESAVEHQKRAICQQTDGADERRATLAYYTNFLQGGPQSLDVTDDKRE